MTTDHEPNGFVEYNDEFFQFTEAKCDFTRGFLHLEAAGSFGKLILEISFEDATDIEQLKGCSFNPPESEIYDAVGASGFEIKDSFLSFNKLRVICTRYSSENGTASFSFQGEAEDLDWGGLGQLNGEVHCLVDNA